MHHRLLLIVGGLLAGLLLTTSCSTDPAVRTTQLRGTVDAPLAGGVIYYLPKRVLKIGIWEAVDYVTIKQDRVVVDMQEDPPRYFGTILDVLTVPDRNYMMRLTQDPSASFSESVTVQMTQDGLLTEVATQLKDESPAIVAELASLATLLAKAPLAVGGGMRRKSNTPERTWSVRITLLRTLIVDPTDPASYAAELASYVSADAPGGIVLQAAPLLAGTDACCTLDPEGGCTPVCAESGVCYRPAVPYRVSLRPGGRANAQSADELEHGIEEVILLPNRSPVVCLPIDRVPFVDSQFHVKFEHGMLTYMKSVKPSQVLGFLRIPIDVAKAIVGIPGELLQFRVTHYDNVRKAAAGEEAAFKAIEQLSKAQQGGG